MQAKLNMQVSPDGKIMTLCAVFSDGNGRMVSLAFDAERADITIGQEKWEYREYPVYSDDPVHDAEAGSRPLADLGYLIDCIEYPGVPAK